MARIKWPVALATLFVLLLGWYVVYTQQIVRALRADAETLARISVEVQQGLSSTDPTAEVEALVRLQNAIIASRVPLVQTGPRDTVHLVLGHASGASSTLTLSQTVPVPVDQIGFQVWGPQGRSATPAFELDHLGAMGEAVRQLAATAAAGGTAHPCDVRLGRDAVAVLDAAERFLSAGPETRAAAVG